MTHESTIVILRYSDGANTGNPGDPSSADPGPGILGLSDVDGTTTLVPLLPGLAPNATRAVSMTVSFQSTADGRFLGFMNTTSWEPLSGTTTLLSVLQNPTRYAPAGVGLGVGDQLIFTEDSVQVVDLRVVRVLLHATQV
jgi:iron transport multicopper oxidase